MFIFDWSSARTLSIDNLPSPSSLQVTISQPARKVVSSAKAKKMANALGGLSAGFDWAGADAAEGSDSDSDEESDQDVSTKVTSQSKPKKKSNVPQDDHTADIGKQRPESTADFERALMASPNSSYLWVQFMSFQLELNEIAKAKEIGRRALKVIAIREEEEKLNVWMALLNLENAHGTPESLDKLFREAVQYNDALTVHLRFAKVLTQTEKYEAAEDVYKRAGKKFGASVDLWTQFAEFYFTRQQLDEARALLPRSLKSLVKQDHASMIEKFAILEFRYGDAERGKTIYEGLIDKFGKKLNIWSTYIDQVAKQGDIQAVRGLVDRALDQKLNAHKAKFLFKKLLALENRIGDDAGQDKAKAKARDWVMANASAAVSSAQQDEEDDEDEDDE